MDFYYKYLQMRTAFTEEEDIANYQGRLKLITSKAGQYCLTFFSYQQ